MFRGYGLPLVVVALALVVMWLVLPDKAGAQVSEYCPTNGIAPGSVQVISTNNGAGEVSGHVVRFQLCGGIDGSKGEVGFRSPLKIGLLWETGAHERWWGENEFRLSNLASAGITLSEAGNARVWPATGELSESADPERLYRVYSAISSRGYGYRNFQGVTVEFGPADLLESLAASGDLPLSLQFNVPVSAGLRNPEHIGEYSWLIVLYHDFINSCEAKFASATSTIVPAYMPGELQFFPKAGRAGSVITVVGNGFPESVPVRLAKIGAFDLSRFPPLISIKDPAAITDSLGAFKFEVGMPGFDLGPVSIEVQVGEKTVSAEFILIGKQNYNPPYWIASKSVADLGDNFVTAFFYDTAACRWRFYDPEFPGESDLTHLITGEPYWILVTEPANAVLGNETRNLTCTSDGNCWNRIVW